MVYREKEEAPKKQATDTPQGTSSASPKPKNQKKPAKENVQADAKQSEQPKQRPVTAKPSLQVMTQGAGGSPLKQVMRQAGQIDEPVSAARVYQMNLAPITTKKDNKEGQTRNFELEERVRNLESTLMDAQQKVEDTYAQLRQAQKETQTLR